MSRLDFDRWRSREDRLWQAAIAASGLLVIGMTLHLYPTIDLTRFATAKTPLSPAAADRQIESAKSTLTTHPDDLNSYMALAIAYYQKGPDHYVEAMNALEKARALGATNEQLFYYAGVMYESLGLPDYAANEFAKYLRHHPNDYETMIRLANLYFRQKRLDEAMQLYKHALHEWPKDATAWFNFAVINKEKGNYPLALNSLDQVIRIAGQLPEGGLFQRGEIYRLQGDPNKALQFYQQELAAHPDYVPALEATEAMARASGDLKQARLIRKRISEVKKRG